LLPVRRLQSLKRRPRVRRLAERLASAALLHSGSAKRASVPVPPPPPPAPVAVDFRRDQAATALTGDIAAVSHRLYRRLDEVDVAEVERRLPEVPELSAHVAITPAGPMREALILIAGTWLAIPAVVEKTRVSAAQPPEGVHAMARGPLAAGGGLYEADMVAGALEGAGITIEDVRHALDFGCSSGRVLRVLHAAYTDTEWRGCDPNEPAIEWASENLPGIELFVSADEPPLPLADASLDLAYAISIWSHFEPGLGVRWFEEMHRLIRPGGHLVCTTHGLTSIAHYALGGMRTPEQSREIADALYSRGWWYAAEFGEEGDWGVVNPSWGTAFLSPEWMLTQLCPRWRVLEFAPGRNQNNQDVYVLERV
jgi:SAM-dependent methyltransferase